MHDKNITSIYLVKVQKHKNVNRMERRKAESGVVYVLSVPHPPSDNQCYTSLVKGVIPCQLMDLDCYCAGWLIFYLCFGC